MTTTQPSSVPAISLPARHTHRRRGLWLNLPAIAVLLLWSVVPLLMTLWFSFQRYNLMDPNRNGFDGWGNYRYLFSDAGLPVAIWNTALLLGAVLVITIGLGTLIAVLLDQEFFGRGIVRILMLAPFFVMPTVSALVWKNMLMHPDNGFFAFLMRSAGLKPIDWFAVAPLTSVILIVSWEWLPFAVLTLLTSVQSLDPERKERPHAWTALVPSPCCVTSSGLTCRAPSRPPS